MIKKLDNVAVIKFIYRKSILYIFHNKIILFRG